MFTKPLIIAVLGLSCAVVPGVTDAQSGPAVAIAPDASLAEIGALYRKLIDAENRHDLAAVRQMVWDPHRRCLSPRQRRPRKATGPDSGPSTLSCSTSANCMTPDRSGSIPTTARSRLSA
jgi:hypothetical protein